jgi:hypothetical protein
MSEISPNQVLWALAMRKGEANGIHARDLVREICGETSPGLERQLRSVIEELRMKGQHICGKPKSGYFIAATEIELKSTTDFLRDRGFTSLAQAAAMLKVSMPDLLGQMRLPT